MSSLGDDPTSRHPDKVLDGVEMNPKLLCGAYPDHWPVN
jgi:hypothetical protein